MSFPQRKAQRLQGFDYSRAGMYFFTICVKEHRRILSVISYSEDSRRDSPCGCPKIHLTELGRICEETLPTLEEKFDVAVVDYVIMPDHIHFILHLPQAERTTARVVPTVSSVVGAYKSLVSVQWLKVCKQRQTRMDTLWERSFYDHVIRDDEDFYCKQRYLQENPLRWCIKYHFIEQSS